jgi:hypothetical protein
MALSSGTSLEHPMTAISTLVLSSATGFKAYVSETKTERSFKNFAALRFGAGKS